MKQTLYILLIIAISLASCANNGDEPTPTPIPPNPPVVLSADAVIGIWETYYYTKAIRANPGTSSEVSYQGLRLIDYDGFKTEFYKSEDNTYRFKSVNVLNDLIDEGIYWVNEDTLKFKFEIKPGKDTLTWQKVRVFDSAKGILKTDASYWGTNNNKVKYIITDTKCQRNIDINPEYSDVNPAKVKIDFDYLAKTKWEIYSFAYYEGGQYRDRESTLGGDTLKGLTYRFYTDPTGERRCHLTQRIPGTDELGEKDLPIVIVDDVISFVDVERDSSGKIIKGTDNSFFMWAREWKERYGVESFIDWKEERFQDDISVVIRTESFVRRVSD
ncbi:hypothetical protein JGH11_13705 [Dysgonomonas sp. Marseille-P4677]|uniref:hypothetical protein n=1 Tax=Dysgonomonas sp. Marseille-P4677 TaxID=2364790 RepID=UPI00191210E0|nr:hypothetical protein [Dysgonomonas sp. Marseille-P4677]MBK5721930.1 hypothetical protein [Dysgonomonas sp. Marseille-P4677]